MKRFWSILVLVLVPSMAFGGGLEFRGSIGESLKIVMTLRFSEAKVIGYFYYAKYENEKNRPYMKVEGTMDEARNISVAEIDMKKGVTGRFKGKFTCDKTIEGEWSNADASKTMPFSVSTGRGVDEKDAMGLTLLQTSGLDAQHIAENPDLLKTLFTLKNAQTLTVNGADILVELYLKNGPSSDEDDYTEVLYRVQSGNTITAFTERGLANESCCLEQHKVEILNTTPALLSIEIPTGGNCWNCDPNHLIDLGKGYFLKYLGSVTDASVNDSNGQTEILKDFDLFEGISFFCHADAPGECVFYTPKDGELVPDTAKNEERWKKTIVDANHDLEKAASDARNRDKDATDLGVLAAIKKMICAHLSGREEEGWSQFHNDLLLLSPDGTLLFGNFLGMNDDGLKIKDVEKEIRDGFRREERNAFLKDL